MTDRSYTGGELSMSHGEVESLCCIPETNVTLYVNDTQIKKWGKMKKKKQFIMGHHMDIYQIPIHKWLQFKALKIITT